MTTVLSILLPASLILATLSLYPNIKMGATVFPFFGIAALPGAADLVALTVVVYWITGERVDNVFWKHIHNLEDQLGIDEGHKKIHEELEKKYLYKVRRFIFPAILLMALFS